MVFAFFPLVDDGKSYDKNGFPDINRNLPTQRLSKPQDPVKCNKICNMNDVLVDGERER